MTKIMPSVNPEIMEKLIALGGKPFLKKMLHLFLENSTLKIQEASDGLRQNDYSLAERSFHSIISSAGNIGAERLMSLAREAELSTKKPDHNEVLDRLEKLKKEFELVKTSVEEIQKEYQL